MMIDPYKVLGVSSNASDDEIKKAYRQLSRKYHPDANVNNPNKEQAEEKFKEVQLAYDQIMKAKQSGTSGEGFGADGQGPFGGFYGRYYYNNSGSTGQEENPKLLAAGLFIRTSRYMEAVNVLNEVPFSERQGRWYFYSAIANHGLGNDATALEHIQRAVTLEPSNIQYRQFKQNLEFGGTWYSGMGSAYGRPYSRAGSLCASFLCLELLFGCCCDL